MNHHNVTVVSDIEPKEQELPFFKPAEAWGLILLFCVITAILLLIGGAGSRVLNVSFPLGAFLIGWRLYFRYPILYTGFVWWLFFLTPLVRRIADWKAGSLIDPSPILLTPYLPTIISAHTLYFNISKTREQGSAPFILAIAGVMYGFLIGLINNSDRIPSVTVAFLEWMSPIIFAYHIYVNWKRYPEYARNIQRVFLWGVIVMGVYGIFQFLTAPEWDRFWLINSPIKSSAGQPVPLGIRVWSTMNAPGPFAYYMAAGLTILLNTKNALVVPAAGSGALAFLLSIVRTSWIGWFLGIMTMIGSIKPKQRKKLFLSLICLLILIIPLATIEPFSNTITARMSTLSNINEDGSFQARQYLYNALIDEAIVSFVGSGIGTAEGYDSAVLAMLFNLGWIGCIPYIGSLILLTIALFNSPSNSKEMFPSIVKAIVFQSIFYLFAGASMKAATGMLLWSFLSFGFAQSKYQYYDLQLKAMSAIAKKTANTI
ncbi:O-antigen ligase domain-containing protein [Pseudanabaena sp. FACHB-1998]|uniref:O-antigen ligase domain-containing protein n=1 Tax=Pseudanabaena sp. FACHB-1998 TaxID=2692858 RepID=UPI0016815469|nr:O-antigen ligase domain-containing protein [Pseudanabaena sp. FACHB-1998]MBD2177873.1 O-antigen ligase domain-containing protein [Pseudanabaena sp. FACHB-1998]